MLGHGIAPGWGCTSELQFLACSWAKSLARAAPRVNADLAVSKAGSGGPGQSRTADLRFRKPLLYPSELRGQRGSPNFTLPPHLFARCSARSTSASCARDGAWRSPVQRTDEVRWKSSRLL